MRASRLLAMLLLLTTRGQLSARELADELEVSVRTVYRDAEALSEAGVPVYATRGREGGFAVLAGYRTRLTGLTGEEADAVLLAGLPGPAAELGLGGVLAATELKLLAALPPELRERASRIRDRFHLDAPGWLRETETPPHLAALAEAVWSQQRMRVRYERANRAVVDRLLDPLGVVLKAGVWYLVACVDQSDTLAPQASLDDTLAPQASLDDTLAPQASLDDTLAPQASLDDTLAPQASLDDTLAPQASLDDTLAPQASLSRPRTYRVSRVLAAAPTGTAFERPADFDLPAHWQDYQRDYADRVYSASATIRISADGRSLLFLLGTIPARAAHAAMGPPDADGWATTTVPIESVLHGYHALLQLGADVEVLAPAELRELMTAGALALTRRYRVG